MPRMKTAELQNQMAFSLDGVAAHHWDWVQRLIEDVKEQEEREHLIALWAQWRMASRQFRHVEFAAMRQEKPSPADLIFHRMCLAGLMSVGDFLLIGLSKSAEQEDLKKLGFDKADAEAALAALRHNWEEWHGFADSARLDDLVTRISSLNATAPAH